MKNDEYKRTCSHKKLHWKDCPECREYLVRSGFKEKISSETSSLLKDIMEKSFHYEDSNPLQVIIDGVLIKDIIAVAKEHGVEI